MSSTVSGVTDKANTSLSKPSNGPSPEIVPAPILEGNEIYNAVLRDCKQDLNVCSFPVLNFDQINDLVNLQKSGDLDPEKIESIFKRGQKAVPPMKTVYREEDPSDDVPPNELFTESRTAVTPTKPEPPKSEPVKEVPPKKIEEEKKPETAPTASTGMSIQDKIAAMRAKAKSGVPQ